MFDWLEQEISAIKTPRFHLVAGPADPRLREVVLQSILGLPASYKEFVLKFGETRLYRKSRSGYRIGIFAGPRKATLDDGAHIYHIGWHDGASVYVKPESSSSELPIFEFEDEKEERVALGFKEWLRASCARARNVYGKKWAEILRGPVPFTSEEKELLKARGLMRWRVLGIDEAGNHIFEVTNAGHRSLHTLTIGVRSKNGLLNGAIRLHTADIGPGKTKVLHADCYKDLVPPMEIEAFLLPDPEPEDREFYWEFETNRRSNTFHE